MENKNQGGFSYTYSAKEKTEIENIRKKYISNEESKIERLRRLDAQVSQKAQIFALTLGIVGVLILGFGMSLFMSDLGSVLKMSGTLSLTVGVVLGIIGGAMACIAYPVHNRIVKKQREKIAPEILKLTDELMK